MAGNRRGKLKENFEGVHRNFDWAIVHCQKSVALIAGDNPKLTKSIEALAESVQLLDEMAQGIYKTL